MLPREQAAYASSLGFEGYRGFEQEVMVVVMEPFKAGERPGAQQGNGKAPDGLGTRKLEVCQCGKMTEERR